MKRRRPTTIARLAAVNPFKADAASGLSPRAQHDLKAILAQETSHAADGIEPRIRRRSWRARAVSVAGIFAAIAVAIALVLSQAPSGPTALARAYAAIAPGRILHYLETTTILDAQRLGGLRPGVREVSEVWADGARVHVLMRIVQPARRGVQHQAELEFATDGSTLWTYERGTIFQTAAPRSGRCGRGPIAGPITRPWGGCGDASALLRVLYRSGRLTPAGGAAGGDHAVDDVLAGSDIVGGPGRVLLRLNPASHRPATLEVLDARGRRRLTTTFRWLPELAPSSQNRGLLLLGAHPAAEVVRAPAPPIDLSTAR